MKVVPNFTSASYIGAAIREEAARHYAPGRLALDDATLGRVSLTATVEHYNRQARLSRAWSGLVRLTKGGEGK